MAACQVQHGVEVFFRIVFHLLQIQRVGMARVRPAQQKVQHQPAQHVVHYAVQLAAAQIGTLFAVADFIGGVLPDFADQRSLRIAFFQFTVKCRQEFVRQFVRHVQTPAADAGFQPVLQHTVFVFNYKILIAAVRFVHFRQAFIPPPAAVFFRILFKLIPGIVRGFF